MGRASPAQAETTNCTLLLLFVENGMQQQKQIAEISRQLAEQTRELAQQKAGNEKLKEQMGDLSTLQIIQVAKKTQKKPAAGTKKGSQKRKTTASDKGPKSKKVSGPSKKAPPPPSKKAPPPPPPPPAVATAVTALLPTEKAGSNESDDSGSNDELLPAATQNKQPRNPTDTSSCKKTNGPKGTPDWLRAVVDTDDDEDDDAEKQEKRSGEPCANCGHNYIGCDHGNYSFLAYNREENTAYFKDGAKYAGYSCCNCKGSFVVLKRAKKTKKATTGISESPTNNNDNMNGDASEATAHVAASSGDSRAPAASDDGKKPKTIAVTAKMGVYMCKQVTGDCRHMLCVDCFNTKQGLVGKACQWAEGIGIAARTERRKRGCTQKK